MYEWNDDRIRAKHVILKGRSVGVGDVLGGLGLETVLNNHFLNLNLEFKIMTICSG